MRIVHICISDPYVDNWGYQSNLLPQYLLKAGHENFVIASANDFPSYLRDEEKRAIISKGLSYQIGGVCIRRIKTHKVSTAFIIPKGIRKILEEIKPDAIFHHNFNCTSLPIAARYARKNSIPMMVDNHADTINMTRNKLWAFVYYRVLIGLTCKLYKREILKAYGVTQSRCVFIHYYYGMSSDKIDFLPIGADVDLADTISSGDSLREKYGFAEQDFIIVTGGKMGKGKGTDCLVHAVEELKGSFPHIKLVLFGKFEDDETERLATESKLVTVFGWCNRSKTLELLKMANVACWPIHHTTLIEDAISVCTPIINRKTGTSAHLINGNGIWIENGSIAEIRYALMKLLQQNEQDQVVLRKACESMKQSISYHAIVRKVLNDLDVGTK